MYNKSKRILFCFSLFVVFSAVSAIFIIKNNNAVLEIFSLAIALGGLIGLYFQLKDSRDFNEGSFITQLNDSFNNNEAIQRIYRKLQLNEPINDSDTPDIVAYLTFFETISILKRRNILNFNILNDLFSYRFFLAINNRDIQRISLVKYDTEYVNLYKLENSWIKYLEKKEYKTKGVSILKDVNPNYDILISGKRHSESSMILRKADVGDSKEIAELMKKVHENLDNKSLFVCDNLEYVTEQLSRTGFGVVAEHNRKIVGSFILRYPFDSEDNLGADIGLSPDEMNKVIHFESAVVDEAYRGNGLQQKMMVFAESLTDKRKFNHFLSTVSPNNIPSLKSFENNGFKRIKATEKYNGLERIILYKKV